MSEFTHLIDLASERLGGKALLANDDFFAPKENMLKAGRGVFVEGRYTDRGKWMDGWETRRRRSPGHDWCIIRLGLPGVVRGVTIDTNHFKGNAPEAASIDACDAPASSSSESLTGGGAWREILGQSRVLPHAENHFEIREGGRCSHIRLNIHPDGGVARLRAHGEVIPDWSSILAPGRAVDLAAVEHGGLPVACSDQFFGEPRNLIMPGRADNMGDGWETRRRRGPGYDWVVVRLGRCGMIERILVDTNHFKGNYPDSCSIEGCNATKAMGDALRPDSPRGPAWVEMVKRTKLEAHREHMFEVAPQDAGPATHIRLNVYPDGGVSRLRVFGKAAPMIGAGPAKSAR